MQAVANIRLLRHQKEMLKTIFQIFFKWLRPSKGAIQLSKLQCSNHNILPKEKIVLAYHQWLQCHQRYHKTIAPHLFPLWSYPNLFKLGEKLNLPLHKVLNQGCKMIINHDIPLNSPLNTKIEIFDMKDLPSKYRINQRITTSTKDHHDALISEIYAVILKDTKSILSKKRKSSKIDTDSLTFLARKKIQKADAQSYAYLSGDINPIHLSQKIAKLMGLKGSIMHGFGLFAMIYEILKENNFNVTEIDIKFLAPVYLENDIEVFIQAKSENQYQLRVLDSEHKVTHLGGSFKIKH
ncbi:MAG: hypothetical protein CME66_06815 [Halobacteriovoraceae bacterium]|nr:hypothetical protein [Halobacteriovoraceae bacterium]